MTDVTSYFSISLRCFAEFENYMTSVQKIILYTELEEEDALKKLTDATHEKNDWP